MTNEYNSSDNYIEQDGVKWRHHLSTNFKRYQTESPTYPT